jgi:hypothetical protein
MFADNPHIVDDELVLALEEELPPRRERDVDLHLASCAICCARMEQLKNTLATFSHAYRDSQEKHNPLSASSHVSLKRRIAGETQGNSPESPRKFIGGLGWTAVLAASVLAVISFFVFVRFSHRERAQETTAEARYARPLPDTQLTPGAVRTVASREVCGSRPDPSKFQIPATLQTKVFQEYGMSNVSPESYEVDYLITPELGGADDIRNLWPEPHADTEWNAHVKDQLENYLRDQVCEGRLNLSTAQRDISVDWVSAYKKYLHTDAPLPSPPGQIRN